ncbi:MAG TPA: hypothetical protein VE861_03915 [Gemmatimonadaceae bacterium]|nr:hypothetical protein [Gemmatimonadaceae bacterium]
MSRTKLQRALHVRVTDPGNAPTVAVRFYTQSDGVDGTAPVGVLHVAHQFFGEVLKPLLLHGARATQLPITIDVRPRGEIWRDDATDRARPAPLSSIPRLGTARADARVAP